MPTYTFYNKRTKKQYTELMSISEMEEYLTKNKHISQVIVPINIVAGVSGLTHKNDQGWKENMSRHKVQCACLGTGAVESLSRIK